MSDTPREQGTVAGADFHSILWRLPGIFAAHRRMFLVTFACVAFGAVAGTYLKRQYFESNARLLVKLDQRDVSLSQIEVRYELAQRMMEEAVATQAELLQSRESIGMIVDQLGVGIVEGPKPTSWIGRTISAFVKSTTDALDDGLAAVGLVTKLSPQDVAVETIQKNLKIYPVRRAQLIEVSFRARRSDTARQVLDVLISLRLSKLAELNALGERYEFYRKQSEQFAKALHEAEASLAGFKAKNAVVDLPVEKSMIMHKIERLTSLLEGNHPGAAVAVASAVVERETGIDRAEIGGVTTPLSDFGASLGHVELSQLTARLNQLKLERARRVTLFNEYDLRVQELDNQIALAERMLSNQTAQITRLINSYKARLATLDRIEPELRQLQREVVTGEESYKAYLKATEDRRISVEGQRVILQVVDQPSLPIRALPSRLLLLAIGLAVALLAAVATVLVAEYSAARALTLKAGAAPLRTERAARIGPG